MHTVKEADIEHSLRKVDNNVFGEILYSSIYFTYPGSEKTTLNNISIKIPPYSLTCLVGKPKCGKSTFLKLLIKLHQIKEGAIRLGKTNINDINSTWLRNRIGYVPQKTALFGETIREALRGEKGPDVDNELMYVCRMVNVHSYITSLQQVLCTCVCVCRYARIRNNENNPRLI